MPQQFTQTQKLAIDSNARNICVSAGAGSGKTGVLVERFMRIITESVAGKLPINQRAGVLGILVVTFTDRATKEMKARIVERLNTLGLIEERRQLEAAYISTIHGMCSRLLKENPFEAGVDPGFTVIDENTEQRMLRSAFIDVIVDSFQTKDTEITDLLAEVINDPTFSGSDLDGPSILASEAASVMGRLRGAGVTLHELQEIIQTGLPPKFAEDPVQALLRPTFIELAACIDDLRQMAASASGIVHRAVASILNAVGQMSVDNDILTHINNVQSMRAAGANARALSSSAPSAVGLAVVLDRINKACDQVSELFATSPDREANSKRKCLRLVRLISKAWNLYSAAKRQAAMLDNNDLLVDCVRLLEDSPDVRQRCQNQFRHLMIDEFQDTDLLQARILELLHVSKSNEYLDGSVTISETRVSQNSLFIVGDVQQSIYGFRNSDPEIFRRTERLIREDAHGLHVQLNDNFRSRSEILRIVQQVFEIAWHGESAPFVPLHSSAHFENKSVPSIEVLVTTNIARREYVHLEAEAIAIRLKAFVQDSDNQVNITYENDPRCGTPAGYGDIAMLVRGLTDIQIYEEAFARHGVPALVTAGGRGYYARREIQDLLSVLALLDSPLDDSALLAALRSPFVGVEVDTIYRLGVLARGGSGDTTGRNRGPLYPALSLLLTLPELPETERTKIVPFLSALDRLWGDVDKIPVARLIERLIVHTNYDMRLACRQGGRRKMANVRKLVQIALADPDLSVCEFVARIRDLEVVSDREGDAPNSEEGAGVVRIMTIHSAKGLEFPIVVLPDLSRGLVSPETGLFACDPVSRAIGAKTCGEPDAMYIAVTKSRQAAERYEYLRVLYVAITRAREHLIMCGNVGRNRGFNWADVVFPALGITSASAALASPARMLLKGGVEATLVPFLQQSTLGDGAASFARDLRYEAADRLVEDLLRGNAPDEEQ